MFRIFESRNLDTFELAALLERPSSKDTGLHISVSRILKDIEVNRLDAIYHYAEQFHDYVPSEDEAFFATKKEFDQAEAVLSDSLKAAFRLAYDNITAFHILQKQSLQDRSMTLTGTRVGFRYVPVESYGVYVPGGLASYPSSVLMGCLPGYIAGVPPEDCTIYSPPSKSGRLSAGVLYCARLCGISKVVKLGAFKLLPLLPMACWVKSLSLLSLGQAIVL